MTGLRLMTENVERNIHKSSQPQLGMRVATTKSFARMKPEADFVLCGRVAEARINGFADFARIRLVNNSVIRRFGAHKDDVLTGNGLQMTVTHVQFPTPKLLEKTDRR